jgi:hypothetical protein
MKTRSDRRTFLKTLYDLSVDPGEKEDLTNEYPERVEAMQKAVTRWLQEVTPS